MLFTDTLNKNKDFLFLYKKGEKVISKAVVFYYRRNNKPFNRIGITTSKKLGNAVKRNRARRVIRQAYRENEVFMPVGYDIVMVARFSATTVKSDVISRFIKNVLVAEINKSEKKKLK